MGKVFTITEGLENMGALKTGGQGSVYKGRRTGEIITAVKLLPTPIHSETAEDKNYIGFKNEVEKLKKVNEQPNPNVVKILSSGITETGNFPFIEMEFIEGPDVEELLKPPHDPVFTIKEAIKFADHLSHALAHCHKVDVKHGDIKSNNVKFNIYSGNYVLLDFGLAVMSDEQRRTSLRHAGAIEFMAPEQNEGKMLFQTDVYSYGIILFELLAGIVPFPLKDKGETARNLVMVSHMETPVPDLISLRINNMPQDWSAEKREREMHVPEWLISMIYKCLEKDPEARFANGMELHEYLVLNSTLTAAKNEMSGDRLGVLQQNNQKLAQDKEQLQKFVKQYQDIAHQMEQEIKALKSDVAQKDNELSSLSAGATSGYQYQQKDRGVSKTAFFILLFIAAALGVFAAISLFKNDSTKVPSEINTTPTDTKTDEKKEEPKILPSDEPGDDTETVADNNTTDPLLFDTAKAVMPDRQPEPAKDTPPTNKPKIYKVASARVYFHNEPNESTRRTAYMIPSNDVLVALREENGFVYTEFTNTSGQTSKGWLKKSELDLVEQ